MDQRLDKRLALHAMLEDALGSGNVYFQAPDTVQMRYPAIRYKIDDDRTAYADDRRYTQWMAYQLILIDRDPDSPIFSRLKDLKFCRFDRHYVAENLNHFVFRVYF